MRPFALYQLRRQSLALGTQLMVLLHLWRGQKNQFKDRHPEMFLIMARYSVCACLKHLRDRMRFLHSISFGSPLQTNVIGQTGNICASHERNEAPQESQYQGESWTIGRKDMSWTAEKKDMCLQCTSKFWHKGFVSCHLKSKPKKLTDSRSAAATRSAMHGC